MNTKGARRPGVCDDRVWPVKLFYWLAIPAFFYITVLSMAAPANSYELLPVVTVSSVLLTRAAAYRYRTGMRALLLRWCENRRAIGITVAVWGGLLLYFSLALQVDFTWDYGSAMRAAYQLARGESFKHLEAYARYPNNQILVVLLYAICKVFLLFAPGASVEAFRVLGCVLSASSVFGAGLIFSKAASLFDRLTGKVFLLIYMTCIPLWLYSTICYTDTLGLPLLAGACLCVAEAIKGRGRGRSRFKWLALHGVLMGMAFLMKVTLCIAFIAILIAFHIYHICIKRGEDRVKTILCADVAMLLPFVLTVLLLGAGTQRVMGITPEMREKYEFPKTHWVMMSLYTGDEAYGAGGYRQEDVDYTQSFENRAQRDAAVWDRLAERLQEPQRSLGEHILFQKVRRTWANGTFAADDYMGRGPVKQGLLHDIFIHGGTYWEIARGVMQVWWALLLALTLLGMILRYREGRLSAAFVCHLTVFGFFLFYLIWETNSRYLVVLVPILALAAADGLNRFTEQA